jgi:peptide/nickel transport system substrate-binding protein
MTDEPVARLIEHATRLRWNRRQVLTRAAALGLSAPAISVVLAACGGGSDDKTATSAPAATTPTTAAATGSPAAATATTGGSASGGASPTTAGSPSSAATATTGNKPAATAAATASGPTGKGGIVNISNTNGDTQVGNPILATATTMLPYYMFSRLMVYDDTGSLRPELASEWSFSPDNTELTLKLRTANWHDGQPFSADDVIFTFDTIKDDKTDTDAKSKLKVGGDFVTWEKVDDATVKMTLKEAFAPILYNLNDVHIIPKHLLETVSDINTDGFNTKPVGTGPFKFSEWQADQYVKMVRNDDYWGGEVRPDGLTVFFQSDTNVAIASLEAGDMDAIFTPPESQPAYDNKPGFKLHNYVYFTPITLAFNHKHPILQDVKVRQAISMAIDKQSLTESVTKGRGLVANNQFADTGPLDRYNDYDNVKPVTFDVDAANKLLDDAGYAMGDDGIRQTTDGKKFSFNIITYSGFEEYQNDMVILQEMLKEIGMEIKPNTVEYTTLEGMWADENDDPENRALELEEWPHPFEFDPDLYNELSSHSLPPGQNYMWFKDDQCDQLIDQGRTTTDPDKRVDIYKQLDVRRAEVIPAVPLYIAVDGWVTSDKLKGVADTPYFRRYYLTNAQDWWKEA